MTPDLGSYDKILVMFSGGKDSLWCVLYLLALGVPREKIELWHHDIDGREGSTLMDWRCTRDYCRKFAAAFGLTIYFSWKVGGFEGELNRKKAPTSGYRFETPDGLKSAGGKSKKLNEVRYFPQQAASLMNRWCSAYLKIMVMVAAITGQKRFVGKRTLVVTGERGEESSARAQYEVFEPAKGDLRNGRQPRHVDHWRPALRVTEAEVWALIKAYAVNVHPAYRLGWGRVSCAACIFGNADQWASLRVVNKPQIDAVAVAEAATGKTISRKRLSVLQQADAGTPYRHMTDLDMRAAVSDTFDEPMIIEDWTLPAGAFGDSCGPT